jgi:copper(I)-binding protein
MSKSLRHLILPLAAASTLTAISIIAAFAYATRHESPAPADSRIVNIAASDAADTKAGDLTISGGWLRAMLPGQPAGGGYLTIANSGTVDDRLVSVSTPAAGKSEIHMMEMKNDVMIMRPVDGSIEIPAGATVELKPGGLHLMFMQVIEPFKEGATVPVTLEFEKAGKVEVDLPVKAASGH